MGKSGGFDPGDFNRDGKVDWRDMAEYDFNDEWFRNHSSDDDTRGCCYLILIGIAVFCVLAILSIIF